MRRPPHRLPACATALALALLAVLVSSAQALVAAPLHATTTPTSTGSGLSGGEIAIAIAAGLVALACLAWAIARRRAFEPRWLLSLRHTIAEAGYRASETWAEFGDWLRLGR